MGPPLRAVLFDWDGTIVDSAELSYRCYESLFASFGLAFGRAEFERTYSPNWHRTYLAVGLPEARWAEADALWLALYSREHSRMIPGAREGLLALAGAGRLLGLVTSGDRQRVQGEIARFGLDGRFAVVVCGNDVVRKKPHPEGLHRALERLGVAAAETAYVGDSPEDVEMARAAGVFAVGIPGGFPNREALRASCPDLLAVTFAQAVDRLVAG